MGRLGSWLVSDRLVMAVIVINATALVLHEMSAPSTAAFWFWVDYACVVYFLMEVVLKVGRDGIVGQLAHDRAINNAERDAQFLASAVALLVPGDRGEIYGLDHDPERFEQDWLKPKTDIPGLYLTGQDIVSCGVTGAMVGGLLTAVQVGGLKGWLLARRMLL